MPVWWPSYGLCAYAGLELEPGDPTPPAEFLEFIPYHADSLTRFTIDTAFPGVINMCNVLTKLTYLNVGAELTSDGLSLPSCTSLTHLHAMFAHITLEAAQTFTAWMSALSGLTNLSLGGINSPVMILLPDAVEGLTCLESLSLGSEEISPSALPSVCLALTCEPTLTYLSLECRS